MSPYNRPSPHIWAYRNPVRDWRAGIGVGVGGRYRRRDENLPLCRFVWLQKAFRLRIREEFIRVRVEGVGYAPSIVPRLFDRVFGCISGLFMNGRRMQRLGEQSPAHFCVLRERRRWWWLRLESRWSCGTRSTNLSKFVYKVQQTNFRNVAQP